MSDLVGNPEDRFSHNEAHIQTSRAGCTTLTMLLVTVSLKIQLLVLQLLHRYFNDFRKNVRIVCIAKDSHIFQKKKIIVYLI